MGVRLYGRTERSGSRSEETVSIEDDRKPHELRADEHREPSFCAAGETRAIVPEGAYESEEHIPAGLVLRDHVILCREPRREAPQHVRRQPVRGDGDLDRQL